MTIIKGSFALALGCIALTACVPVVIKSAHFSMDDAIYIREFGRVAADPPGMVYFPFHGIYVSFSLKWLVLGLHIPDGTVVRVNEPTIHIKSMSDKGPYEAMFTVRAAPHKWVWEPAQFLGLPDPFYTNPDFSGPLPGASSGETLAWYVFVVMNPKDPRKMQWTPQGLTSGTVTLPSLTINGRSYEAQTLSFTIVSSVGLTCALCN